MSNLFLIVTIALMIFWATKVIKKHISQTLALQHAAWTESVLRERESLSGLLGKVADALNAVSQFNDIHDESMRIYGRNNELTNILILSALQFVLFDVQDWYTEEENYEVAFDIQKLINEIRQSIEKLSNFYSENG